MLNSMPGEMFMKDIPSVSLPPTPGKKNLFQEKPTSYDAQTKRRAESVTDRLVEEYLDAPFSLDEIKDSLEVDGFSIERAHLTYLVSEGVLDYNEGTEMYSLNHASPEVQGRIG